MFNSRVVNSLSPPPETMLSNIFLAPLMSLSLRRGEFIAFLDSDDIWVKDKIKIQIEHMLSKNISFLFSSYKVIDKK